MVNVYESIHGWDLTRRSAAELPAAPRPSDTWEFRSEDGTLRGTAWVYYANDKYGLAKPIILSDGFHEGRTELKVLWHGLERLQEEERPDGSKVPPYPFISDLRRRGYDLIILGYEDCTASILRNAEVARQCIERARDAVTRRAPLAVGGFSMGGMITRYILAKMELDEEQGRGNGHQADTYLSYDSPHHGAWIPISIQAMAHVLGSQFPEHPTYKMITSAAARELLWAHLPSLGGEAQEDQKRKDFLAALQGVNNWPRKLLKIGVANGKGEGNNGIDPGVEAVRADALSLVLYTQRSGDNQLVAKFGDSEQRTSGMPEADGGHGGMLEGFGLVRNALEAFNPVCSVPWHSFVPTGSAIAVTGMDPWEDLSASVLTASSSLDAFKCASHNEQHTLMTDELGTWILDHLDRRRSEFLQKGPAPVRRAP